MVFVENTTFHLHDGSEARLFQRYTQAGNFEAAEQYGSVFTLAELVQELSFPNNELRPLLESGPIYGKTGIYYHDDGFYVFQDDHLLGNGAKLRTHRRQELNLLRQGEDMPVRVSVTPTQMGYVQGGHFPEFDVPIINYEDFVRVPHRQLGRQYIVKISPQLLTLKTSLPCHSTLRWLSKNPVFTALVGGDENCQAYVKRLRQENIQHFDVAYTYIPKDMRQMAITKGTLGESFLQGSLVMLRDDSIIAVTGSGSFVSRRD